MFQKVFLFVALFLYVYSIPLRFLPLGLGTRMIFCGLGLVLILLKICNRKIHKNTFIAHNDIFIGIISLVIICLISTLTMFINESGDLGLLRYSLSIIFIFIAGYFISFLFRKVYHVVTFEIISTYIIAVVLTQVVIALLMFVNPSIRTFFYSIQKTTEFDLLLAKIVTEFRLIGFGSAFFGAGIVNGYALMLIATMVKRKEINFRQSLIYAFCFFTIFTLGMMMARVTIIGGLLAIIIIFLPSNKIILRIKRRLFSFNASLLFIPIIFMSVMPLLSDKYTKKMDNAINYGFELIDSYINTGTLKTASTDALIRSYKFPKDFKTYLIGDGYFADPKSPSDSYYMGMDAGYLRLVYYFGLIGLLFYFILQIVPILISFRKNIHIPSIFFFSSFTYVLILNLKGFTDLLFLSLLFCFTNLKEDREADPNF